MKMFNLFGISNKGPIILSSNCLIYPMMPTNMDETKKKWSHISRPQLGMKFTLQWKYGRAKLWSLILSYGGDYADGNADASDI